MLKTKLFILTISIISITLLLSGFVSYKNFNTIFKEQSLKNFEHDKKMITSYIKETEQQIIELSKTISSNHDVKNSIIKLERQELLKLSKQWINLNKNYALSFYDKDKKIIVLNESNSNIKHLDTDTDIQNSKLNQITTKYENNSFNLLFTTEIKNKNEIVGYLTICYNIQKEILASISNRFLNNFVLKSNESEFIFSDDTLDIKKFKNISNSKDYILKEHRIIDNEIYPLKLITIIDKSLINKKLEKTLNTIIFIWIIILIVTIILSRLFTDRYILIPINNLQKSIRKIRNKRSKNNSFNDEDIFTTKTDEIEVISQEFTTLANELDKNIAFLESYKSVMDEGSIVSKSDLKGNITYVNDNFVNVSGYSKDELIGSPHSIVRHYDSPKYVFNNLWKTINDKRVWKGTLKNRKKDGDFYWVDMVIRPILDENDNIVEFIAVRHDITEIMEQRETISKMINTDNLTNLSSRFKLINDIQDRYKPILAFLNIDSFRQVNDFYGHTFGDILIKRVAVLLQEKIQEFDYITLYRTQADEFALLADTTDEFTNDNFYNKIFALLKEINNQNIEIKKEEISINLTAGISSEKKDILLSTANMALRRAKKQNIDVSIYQEEFSLDKIYENNIKWAKKLKSAINEDRIVPFYQPIVNNQTGKYEKYESLVRLIDEDGKVISPYFFLNIAKRSKYYTKLTKIMIRKSFEMFKDKDIEFSINLTIDDILNIKIKSYIFRMLEQYQLNNRVVFEIVESESIENFEKVHEFIEEVKKYGCKIAIDDFGTGYSNFEYLMKLKADYIKIDGSMIKNIHNDSDAKMVVSIIVDFAKKMNMKTIAEFVENEEVLKVVEELGIDYSQGYHFSAPKETL